MRTRLARPAIVGALVLVVVLWWWWPGLTNRSTAVLVVGGERLVLGREPIDRRLREDGFTTTWTASATSWCEVAELLSAELDQGGFRAAVLDASGGGDCDGDTDVVDAIRSAGDVRLIVVDWPDAPTANAEFVRRLGERSDVERVDVGRLLGDVGSEVDCLWWDECPTSGRIVAWNSEGLTESGHQRLARMIVAAVR